MNQVTFTVPFELLDKQINLTKEMYDEYLDDINADIDGAKHNQFDFTESKDLDSADIVSATSILCGISNVDELQAAVREFIDYNQIPNCTDYEYFMNHVFNPALLSTVDELLVDTLANHAPTLAYLVDEVSVISSGLVLVCSKAE